MRSSSFGASQRRRPPPRMAVCVELPRYRARAFSPHRRPSVLLAGDRHFTATLARYFRARARESSAQHRGHSRTCIWLRLDHVGEIAARIVYGTGKYFAVEFVDAIASAMPPSVRFLRSLTIASAGCPRARGFRRALARILRLDGNSGDPADVGMPQAPLRENRQIHRLETNRSAVREQSQSFRPSGSGPADRIGAVESTNPEGGRHGLR